MGVASPSPGAEGVERFSEAKCHTFDWVTGRLWTDGSTLPTVFFLQPRLAVFLYIHLGPPADLQNRLGLKAQHLFSHTAVALLSTVAHLQLDAEQKAPFFSSFMCCGSLECRGASSAFMYDCKDIVWPPARNEGSKRWGATCWTETPAGSHGIKSDPCPPNTPRPPPVTGLDHHCHPSRDCSSAI
jgi:hypothetical protein